MGRLGGGFDTYGLATLGYAPRYGEFLYANIMDGGDRLDGLMYSRQWDNGWGARAFYSKVASEEIASNFNDSDAARDRFAAEGFYKWDGGGASLALMYERTSLNAGHWQPVQNELGALKAWYVNPALMHNWGDFSVHAEESRLGPPKRS